MRQEDILSKADSSSINETESLHGGLIVGSILRDYGVRHVFGIPATYVWSLETGFHENGITRIQFRHQQGAVYAADAYARCSRSPGVCFGSAGTGVTDSVSGINQAWLAKSPVIGLFGMHEWDQSHRGAIQEVYPSRIFDSMTKWSVDIDDRRLIPLYLRRAFRDCMCYPPGPVTMGLTLRALGAIHNRDSLIGDVPRETMARPAPAQGDPAAVARVARMLFEAKRPVIVAGDGVYWADACKELAELSDLMETPLNMRRMARGSLDENHPLAVNGAYRAEFWADADLVVMLGLPLGSFERNGRPPAWPGKARRIVIQEAADEGWAPLPIDECIIGNLRQVLLQILELVRGKATEADRKTWREHLERVRRTYEDALAVDESLYAGRSPIHPWNLSRQVADILDPEATIILDSFLVSTFLTDKIKATFPGQILDSGEGGGFGYGIGMGIGAQLARPGKPVLVLTSDTSIGMGGGDIETALRYRLPVVYLVASHGSLAGGVDCFFKGQIQSWNYLPGLRYDSMYEVLGCHAEHVSRVSDMGPALRRAFHSGRTAVVQVEVDNRVVHPWFETLSFRLGVIAHQLDRNRIPAPF
ncbi:MAG: thiamine pyrophosphate-binding protein, partial [Deltaproteobacteria bacterium]|nr:thiamine pyrophosphate-binding protein [Deltaproteobacteria bacterium]